MTISLRTVSYLGGVIPVIIGCAVLLGYFTERETFESVLPGLVTMNLVTAAGFIFAGASLLFLHYNHRPIFRRLAYICSIVVFLLGFLKIMSIILGYDFRIDGFVFSERFIGEDLVDDFQNRIAPNTAISFFCIGAALMLLHKEKREYLAQAFSLVILLGALVVLLSYFYGVQGFVGLGQYIPMAMNAAIAFISLSLAVLLFQPHRGFMGVVMSKNIAGTLMRRLIVAEIALPTLVGYLGLKATDVGILTYDVALSLIIVTNIVIFIALFWWVAYELDRVCRQLKAARENLELKIVERTRKLAEKVAEEEAARQATLTALERVRVEKEKVLLEKTKYESLFQSIGDAVIVTSHDGNVTVTNKAVENILGFANGDIRGKSFFDTISLEDPQGNAIPESLSPVYLALHSGKATIGAQYFFHRKDGVKIPVVITVTPVILDEKIVGAVLIFRDTHKEREIDKQKTEFVSLASHQLRGPLTTISWYAEMLLHGDVGSMPPEQERYLQEIYHGNVRMIELVGALLDVSRIELGTLNMSPAQADILTIAQDVLVEQEKEIQEKGLKIQTQFDANVPLFSVDQKFLRIAFQNILGNAVKYTGNGGKIRFVISLQDRKTVLVRITDTGCGIPKNQQGKIFTKFFRADNVKNREIDGTGLGLYIAKSIVENSGGKIWFSSPAESPIGGETLESPGTEFSITLPLRGARQRKKE